jgi:hypothetical protein
MTQTHVSEGELVEVERKALFVVHDLQRLANQLVNISEGGRGSIAGAGQTADDLADLAREVSDQVDALCDFIRTSRMID